MLPKIAQELNFALDWFLQGPDTNDMRTVPAFRPPIVQPSTQAEAQPSYNLREPIPCMTDPRSMAHSLIDLLSEKGLFHAIELLEGLAQRHPIDQTERAGVSFPATRQQVA